MAATTSMARRCIASPPASDIVMRDLEPPPRSRVSGSALEPPAAGAAEPGRRSRTELMVVLIGWTVIGLFMTGQYLLYAASFGVTVSIAAAAGRAFFAAAVWAAIMLAAFTLTRRFPLDRRPRLGKAFIHQGAGMVLALGEVVTAHFALRALGAGEPVPFMSLFFQGFPTNLLYYWLFVGIGHGLEFYRRYRHRERQSVHLSARLAQAELHLLKSQLHPHFLFNTLHAISALMHKDVRAAERMIARLSDLLRVALDHAGATVVPLGEELEFLDTYLAIERVRFGERLSVDIDVAADVRGVEVPHMILQPLVENAVRHGISPRAAPGRVRVSARRHERGHALLLVVEDDGVGVRDKGGRRGGGLGLANTRARLEQLYGDDFTFAAGNAPEGGYRVTLSIPLRVPNTADPLPADAAHNGKGYGH
jgi:two-component system, LytTR family, sensor kinase